MAINALDTPSNGHPPRLYFGGWEVLALVLDREVPHPDPDTEDARKTRRLANETVRRATAELVKAGVVERLSVAHRGHRQTYRLNL